MHIALIADVHSNLHALEACLAHATKQGAEQFAVRIEGMVRNHCKAEAL
jgi:hypothetical protein